GDRLLAVRDGVRYRMVEVAPPFFYVPGLDLVVGFTTASQGRFDSILVASNVWSLRGTRE
ncbi:MAG TPA: hypothetical protein VGE86_04125, partial [Thermoanaerobaculia bacterium]